MVMNNDDFDTHDFDVHEHTHEYDDFDTCTMVANHEGQNLYFLNL